MSVGELRGDESLGEGVMDESRVSGEGGFTGRIGPTVSRSLYDVAVVGEVDELQLRRWEIFRKPGERYQQMS